MFESGTKILLFLFLFSSFQALLGVLVLIGSGVSIHDTHVLNNVRPLSPEVSDEEIPLQIFFLLFLKVPFELLIHSPHGATCVDFGVVTHMCGGKGLACKFGNPITETIVTCHDEASLLAA